MRRMFLYVSVALIGVVCLLAVRLLLVPWIAWEYPVALYSDQKSYSYGVNTEYGYRLEQARWFHTGLKLRIWAGSSLDLQFSVPYGRITKVKSRDWLASDRALLLDMEFSVSGSGTGSPGELALLYDFERGELHSCGTASAWFVWSLPKLQTFNTPRCDELFILAAAYRN